MSNPTLAMNNNYLVRALFIILIIPIGLLVMMASLNGELSTNEITANLLSFLLAIICWGIALRFLFLKIFSPRILILLTFLIILRILANYGHFYFIFAPLAGIISSDELVYADFSGDLRPIYSSAIVFIDAVSKGGLYYAVFGDYYRNINNPGVGVLYGTLFSAFGAYGTIAIPWTVIYSAFTSLLIGMIGFTQRLPASLCRAAIFLVFIMPGFFIFPPLYRDNFIIFLLVLSAYIVIHLPLGNIVLHFMALTLTSALLFSLRTGYIFLPYIFLSIMIYLDIRSNVRSINRQLVLSVLVFCMIFVSWNYWGPYLVSLAGRFGSAATSEQSSFTALMPFKSLGAFVLYPAAAIFSLLAPMPWWQSVSPSLLAYQVFTYTQTWFSLTIIIALFLAYRHDAIPAGGSILAMFSLMIYLMAVFGSFNLANGYVQVALPFVILSSIKYLYTNWQVCFAMSTSVVVVVHVALLVLGSFR